MEKSICSICKKPLRISQGAGKSLEDMTFKRIDELGNVEQLLDELKMPPRYICPSCGAAYCLDCLVNMFCPSCKTRVHLG